MLAFAAVALGFGPRFPATFGATADAAFGFGPRFPATLTSELDLAAVALGFGPRFPTDFSTAGADVLPPPICSPATLVLMKLPQVRLSLPSL